jgi:hypothetical protein
MDWAITGGESGPGARVMERRWLIDAVDRVRRVGAALWHKQSGSVASHPNIELVPARITKPNDRFRWLRDRGYELLPHEKGGATIDKETYRELPRAYHELKHQMNENLLSA